MATTKKVKEEEQEFISVPDIPAQMDVKPESDEILFLKKLLQIQDEGGWGKYLHGIINERIAEIS